MMVRKDMKSECDGFGYENKGLANMGEIIMNL